MVKVLCISEPLSIFDKDVRTLTGQPINDKGRFEYEINDYIKHNWKIKGDIIITTCQGKGGSIVTYHAIIEQS